jgi:hypothetical protein
MSERAHYMRHLRTTASTAYAASVARVSEDEFMAAATALGLEPVRGRLSRRETRQVLRTLSDRTDDQKRRERVQTAIYKFADASGTEEASPSPGDGTGDGERRVKG